MSHTFETQVWYVCCTDIHWLFPCVPRYEESAELYAQTQVSFEEVTLKLLQNNQKNALKIFLKQKLDRLAIQVD